MRLLFLALALMGCPATDLDRCGAPAPTGACYSAPDEYGERHAGQWACVYERGCGDEGNQETCDWLWNWSCEP